MRSYRLSLIIAGASGALALAFATSRVFVNDNAWRLTPLVEASQDIATAVCAAAVVAAAILYSDQARRQRAAPELSYWEDLSTLDQFLTTERVSALETHKTINEYTRWVTKGRPGNSLTGDPTSDSSVRPDLAVINVSNEWENSFANAWLLLNELTRYPEKRQSWEPLVDWYRETKYSLIQYEIGGPWQKKEDDFLVARANAFMVAKLQLDRRVRTLYDKERELYRSNRYEYIDYES